MTVIYALLIFCLLIFFHEFGHFAAAKLCGVKVNEFSLGMGPAIAKKQKGDTLYSIRIFPIGGYCSMEGEDEDSDDERAFNKKKAWQKAIIVVAGAFMNLVMTVLILTAVAFSSGTASTTIEQVQQGAPAMAAGIEAGDTVIAIDGKQVKTWDDIYTFISESNGDKVAISLRADDGTERTISCGITEEEETGRRIIGIMPVMRHNPVTALVSGVRATYALGEQMFTALGQLFTGSVGVNELSGPVGIVAVVNETASLGFVYIAYLTALISLNLAIVNMLPFPALDGGRLVFIIIRRITGRAITDEMESKVHFAGILLLFALMIYVTWNDIIKFILPIFG